MDWFHINAVRLDTDGNLLIDARDTWTAYKVNRFTGRIIWQLGGKDSSFTLQGAPGQALDNTEEIFAWHPSRLDTKSTRSSTTSRPAAPSSPSAEP